MFMFRSRRNNSLREIRKHRAPPPHHEQAENDTADKQAVEFLLKKLSDTQLEMLRVSLESRGGDLGECVLFPRGEMRFGRTYAKPQVLCCQAFRWPDLSREDQLRSLPCCTASKDPIYTCCNPYHWSRLFLPDASPLFLDRCQLLDEVRKEDLVQNGSMGSVATGGTRASLAGSGGQHWCSLAYWELKRRVGRMFPVFKDTIHIFSDVPHGEGLCLATLAAQEARPPDPVRRTRDKIALGVVLSRDDEGVWLYNRSDHPVFVHSPTLDHPHPTSRTFLVHKLLPGYSLKVFDYLVSKYYQSLTDGGPCEGPGSGGPVDPRAVRISFAKGWGPHYSRQFVTSCPCWLEILLSEDRPR